jgi:hypothetical protein
MKKIKINTVVQCACITLALEYYMKYYVFSLLYKPFIDFLNVLFSISFYPGTLEW